VEWTSPGAIQDQLFDPLSRLCHQAARAPGVGSVVLGGGPLAGLATRLQPGLPVPVICGTAAAIALLRLVVRQTAVERQLSAQ
jgi:allantoin racemase